MPSLPICACLPCMQGWRITLVEQSRQHGDSRVSQRGSTACPVSLKNLQTVGTLSAASYVSRQQNSPALSVKKYSLQWCEDQQDGCSKRFVPQRRNRSKKMLEVVNGHLIQRSSRGKSKEMRLNELRVSCVISDVVNRSSAPDSCITAAG